MLNVGDLQELEVSTQQPCWHNPFRRRSPHHKFVSGPPGGLKDLETYLNLTGLSLTLAVILLGAAK
jgi:hypothetical protein